MTRTILIVDDEPHIVELIRHHVTAAGFDTLTASNGREALDLALHARPDLVILDVMLPEMDGLEVCRRLREHSDVPIHRPSRRQNRRDPGDRHRDRDPPRIPAPHLRAILSRRQGPLP